MRVFLIAATQVAVFVLVGGWLLSIPIEGRTNGLAVTAIAAGIAYAVTVWPLRLIDLLRRKKARRALSN